MIVLKRILFIILIPVFFINIVIATVYALPYWVITGKFTFDSKLFNDFKNYLLNLHDTTRNTRT
jgi:glucan phosphoethanolaminetransferase (alkaline phosphatase superfamily)